MFDYNLLFTSTTKNLAFFERKAETLFMNEINFFFHLNFRFHLYVVHNHVFIENQKCFRLKIARNMKMFDEEMCG